MTTTSLAPRHRRLSLAAGVLYVLTFVSIPTFALYDPVKGANYVLGPGPDTAAIIGAILEVIVALAGIGTAVVLFPILKNQNESSALGLVAARVLESGTILVGVAFLLSIVTLRQNGARSEALATSHALVALYDRIFLLGQSFMPAVCDLLLGLLLYKSRLVPRSLSLIGIVGALHS
jgi:cytochrome bd-type quinol oxidase subunit 2